jgi:hypothetical protein
VKVQAGHADRLDRVRPGGHLVEVAPPQRAAFGARECQRAWVVLCEYGQVLAERRDDHLRDADDPAACSGIRRPEEHFAGRPLDIGGPYPDGARVQVKASALRAAAGPAPAPGSAVARPARRTPSRVTSLSVTMCTYFLCLVGRDGARPWKSSP